MAAVNITVMIILCIGILALLLLHRHQTRVAEARRRSVREAVRAEDRRIRDCGEVIYFFANSLGYFAREAISRKELELLIDEGMAPEELAATIWERCAATEGLALGYHPLADGQVSIPVLLPPPYRARHVYCVGQTGSGKTTLLRNLVLQDLHAGSGVGVIAPEQELLTEELLPFVPEARWDDVILVNPADLDCPVPLNPLHLDPGEDLDRKVDETFTIFQRIFEDGAAAPRMAQILRQALYALMQVPGATLQDVERLLDRQDPTYRKWVIDRLPDEEGRHFWSSRYPSFPRDAHISLVTRLGKFLRPKVVRNLLCTPAASLDVRAAMDAGKILLFNLSDGILGEANAQLLGELAVAKIQMAAMSRADVPKEARRPFYLYLDEFQSFCGSSATSYEKILSRARKYGLGLVLCHQQTGQIPEPLLREILGNVSTIICFAVGARDARRLSREMVGEVDGVPLGLAAEELLSLRVGESWCKIGRSVFFMPTFPPPVGGSAVTRDEIIRRSRERYGVRRCKPDTTRRGLAAGGVPLETIDPGEVL